MSHKRKSDGTIPPAKKYCPQNGHNLSASKLNGEQSVLPGLPSISPELERTVFTHQSVVGAEHSGNDMQSYERLEFLGDAYVEIISSRLIWNQFKDLPTGRLSKIRETLVKNETLAKFATQYGLDRKLRVSESTRIDGSATVWTKVRGDVFEAYVAAVILSDPFGGFEVAEDWLTQLWLPLVKDVNTTASNLKAKEDLARMLLAKGVRLNYVDERPKIHDKKGGIETYFVGVYLTGWGWTNQHLGSGTGLNKVIAGNEAASKAMQNRSLIDQIVERRRLYLEKKKQQEQLEQKEV